MKLSQRLQNEKAFVEKVLGDLVICLRCRATLDTYAERCKADLSEPCQGYLAIERARKDFGGLNEQNVR